MSANDIVVTDLDGRTVEGQLRPSSDLATHIEIYKRFPNAHGVAHTHSEFATAWAQARRPIPCFGTTHADYYGPIPVTADLTASEIAEDYEKNPGVAICRLFDQLNTDNIPAVLVAGHAPFCWGATPSEASHNAVILESVARMAYYTMGIAPQATPLARATEGTLNDDSYGFVVYRNAGAPRPGRLHSYRVLFRVGSGDWLLSPGPGQYGRRFLHGRSRNDGLGRWPELSFRQSGRAGINGMGRLGLSIRHPCHTLVLDWRYSGDVVSGAGDDAVLLHLENALGAGILEVALWRTEPHRIRRFVRVHDRADERRQHVRHGEGHANCFGMGH